MIGVRTVAEIRAAEAEAFARLPDGALMERASFALASICAQVVRPLSGARIALLIGSGSNGGDALHAGALLSARGAQVVAYSASDTWHGPGATALLAAGGSIEPWTEASSLADADAIVDGLLGIGASGAPRGPMARMLAAADDADALRIAVDIPTGIDADTGEVPGAAFHADLTVTFGALKQGLLLWPGLAHAGITRLVDIGLHFAAPRIRVLEHEDVARWVPPPSVGDHKFQRGVAGIAAGSALYRGAALLAVGGARPVGPGMVRFLRRDDGVADAVVERYPDVVADAADPANQRVDAWACGSGFAASSADAAAVGAVLRCDAPVVLDGGALTLLAADEDLRAQLAEREGQITVLTPHDGEFARLWPDLDGARLAAAIEAARRSGTVVVRKGPGTVIASPDGEVVIDREGTAALSTAGSGDVLAGIIAGLLAAARARGDLGHALDAIGAAVWLHGAAGRRAGSEPVTAPELLRFIPEVVASARP